MAEHDIAFDVTPQRIGREQVTAYIEERISDVRTWIGQRPGPSAGSVSRESLKWSRVYMLKYGRAIEAIEVFVRFQMIPVQMGKEMEQRLKMMMQHYHSLMMLGQR